MSPTRRAGVILIGPPGAGCTSVGSALARRRGLGFADLGQVVAQDLGTTPELALVAVPEDRYRCQEAARAVELIARARAEGTVLALGSGCLGRAEVRRALSAPGGPGAQVVALTATPRTLATRTGMDAPRSVALGAVHHAFVVMARERDQLCRELADLVVDTTDAQVAQTVERIG
ncbi:shikimate kinase [Actinomyces howellii]|uniref:Shikimate kinase 1 n=1 Tax=Actinomyces howellii TaxID=52771 RepID=A0A448HE49_9ACTO|nr:shikimate kinase [Actinomyces howellii]VEG26013.1 Shikimate kinase 1 [Actinomyces howellii]